MRCDARYESYVGNQPVVVKHSAAVDGRCRLKGHDRRLRSREANVMAETKKGNKIVAVPGYTRKQDGKKILVPEHRRSTPETSTGKK
jgi:hypothetical protein